MQPPPAVLFFAAAADAALNARDVNVRLLSGTPRSLILTAAKVRPLSDLTKEIVNYFQIIFQASET